MDLGLDDRHVSNRDLAIRKGAAAVKNIYKVAGIIAGTVLVLYTEHWGWGVLIILVSL